MAKAYSFDEGGAKRIVEMVRWGESARADTTGQRRRFVTSYNAGGFVPCRVEMVSGSAGSATTQCTFRYDVKDLSGNVLVSSVLPQRPRPALGKLVAPATDSIGVMYVVDGDVYLWDPGEVPDTAAC